MEIAIVTLASAAHMLKLEWHRWLAWPLHKGNMQIHEVFHVKKRKEQNKIKKIKIASYLFDYNSP